METGADQPVSDLLKYLPAIYQELPSTRLTSDTEDDQREEHPFLGQFLCAFERVLLGRNDDDLSPLTAEKTRAFPKGLEEAISQIAALFDPTQTPEGFLPWLASWTAFMQRADLDEDKQRGFLAEIIPLYRRRGTKSNLEKLLTIFTGLVPTIREDLAEDRPHHFEVEMRLESDRELVARQRQIARSLIEFAKPAHTFCELKLVFPSMQIGVRSTVGENTLLGDIPENERGA
jgi:phage tail-like protein